MLHGHNIIIVMYYREAQFQLAIAVAIKLSFALLSLLNSPATHTPVKLTKQLSTAAGKLDMEDDLNYFLNGRQPQLSL